MEEYRRYNRDDARRRRVAMVADSQTGMTNRAIAKKYGVSIGSVVYHLKVGRHSTERLLSDAKQVRLDKIRQAWQNGQRRVALTREYGSWAVAEALRGLVTPHDCRSAIDRLYDTFDLQRGTLGADLCWIWTGKVWGRYGYLYSRQHSEVSAHRVSYKIHHGPIPEGLWVLHRCDTPLCVNPDHLFTGTAMDNTHDMMAKGRAGWQREL